MRRFDFGAQTFAIYRAGGKVYATDGLCTHEQADLCDGLVMDHVIECPMHNGRFDIRTGRAFARRLTSTSRPTRQRSRATPFSFWLIKATGTEPSAPA